MNPVKKDKLAVGNGRRKASGEGGNSRRFANIVLPDGRKARVPAAKDACTYICFATDDGGWPERAELVLLYDVTHLVERSQFVMKEMRPGFGMGDMTAYQVVETKVVVEHHEGTFGQIQRWLLCEAIPDKDELGDLDIDTIARGGR